MNETKFLEDEYSDEYNSTFEDYSIYEDPIPGFILGSNESFVQYHEELYNNVVSETGEERYLESENIDFASLDASCLVSEVDSIYLPPPRVPNGHVISYVTVTNPTGLNNVYLEAKYECNFGYELNEATSNRLFCRKNTWIGTLPMCKAYDTGSGLCGPTNGDCQQICHIRGDSEAPSCSCFRGFALQDDRKSCKDVDECLSNNGGCEGVCFNKIGSFQCYCPKGFRLSTNGKSCVDKNECILRNGHGPCQDVCHNTKGSYYCTCEGMIGTRLGSDNHTCEDVDECALDNGGCSHICLNTFGQTFCTCPLGFVLDLDWKTCKDINECDYAEVKEECEVRCINTPGSYYCDDTIEDPQKNVSCNEGFRATEMNTCEDMDECIDGVIKCSHGCINTQGSAHCGCPTGLILRDDDVTCVDVDECASTDPPCSHKCTNNHGSYACECPNGYLIGPDENTCIDDNECLLENGNCSDICVNHPGHYECRCREGFALGTEGGHECHDINECQIDNGGCHQECTNLEGEFICTCFEGFELGDDLQCVDIDECETTNDCSHICSNTLGSYTCSCHKGFELHYDNMTCLDIDECESTNDCSHLCSNDHGFYKCYCPIGYALSDDNKTCHDINECLNDNGQCSHVCVNIEGGYYCDCPPGLNFLQEGNTFDKTHTCVDMNECEFNNANCTHLCINIEGGFKCDCPKGYDKYMSTDGEATTVTCLDIDECLQENGACSQFCENSLGSFKCSCKEGYILALDGITCEDFDECLEENGGCSHNCVNLPGTYKCSCPDGLNIEYNFIESLEATYIENDGDSWKTCVVVDECKNSGNLCSHDCVNHNGGFKCLCPQGYDLMVDQYTCQDIDECLINNGGCFHTCVNLLGSFKCQCNSGYTLTNNSRCIDVNECKISNGNCSDICLNEMGSYSCACDHGYALQQDKLTCKDINECGVSNGGCSHECKNTDGEYKCICPRGLVLDVNHHDCLDVDECLQKPNICSHECENTEGSFTCGCPTGLQLAVDGRICLDVDECGTDNGGCSHQCSNEEGYYTCICPEGYTLDVDSHTCIDVNECELDNDLCDQFCENTVGSYSCSCPEGFEIKLDGFTCQDVDECSRGLSECEGVCQNTVGSYTCICPEGFHLSSNGFECEDTDECKIDNGGCSHYCKNTNGSFKCSCPEGLRLMDNDYQCEDVDECRSSNPCQHKCINTHGSFSCQCEKGFELHPEKTHECQDVDECSVGNGGCSDLCFNTYGSFYCQCRDGHKLTSDNRTCEPKPVYCPVLNAPIEGEITCTAEVVHRGTMKVGTNCSYSCSKGWTLKGDINTTCTARGTWTSTNASCEVSKCSSLDTPKIGRFAPSSCTKNPTSVGGHCYLTCPRGYKVIGTPVFTCTATGQKWAPENYSETRCVREEILEPLIKCPRDFVVDLSPGSKSAYVEIPKPETNVDWARFVESTPEWGKDLAGHFLAGRNVMSFVARSPSSASVSSCSVVVFVRDNEIPEVLNCPKSFRVNLGSSETSTSVTWDEPTFKDNVEILRVYKSMEPKQDLEAGSYNVQYIAVDSQRNRAKCSFVVTVEAAPPAPKHYRSRKMLVVCPALNGGKPTRIIAWRVPRGCSRMKRRENARHARLENTPTRSAAPSARTVAGDGRLLKKELTPGVSASGRVMAHAVSSSGHTSNGQQISSSSAYAHASNPQVIAPRENSPRQPYRSIHPIYEEMFSGLLNRASSGSFAVAHSRAGVSPDGLPDTKSFAHAQVGGHGTQAMASAQSNVYNYG